ncbi:hypothetical protein HWC80_gp063 [Mycobacterium phage Indlulamithi]|uniref:Uncharacterized protein n=1 Tax=Mycobacterium phage Indlulamithi TaxID=2656582 RepID=A0A649VCT9_9CAUD|nr:hypothetical protein HWC80_gp063 [Mycobacterium phage Indlulamithi]QGJ90148.1 hypothetical protein PBI_INDLULAMITHI_111 [Mycobacterium phage Indlulamithi]
MAKKRFTPVKQVGPNTSDPINAIPRDRDNTDDLLAAEQAVHTRYSHIRAPQGTKSKSATKGAFDPADNTAFNGNKVVTRKT